MNRKYNQNFAEFSGGLIELQSPFQLVVCKFRNLTISFSPSPLYPNLPEDGVLGTGRGSSRVDAAHILGGLRWVRINERGRVREAPAPGWTCSLEHTKSLAGSTTEAAVFSFP
jgi:hypothetical protein